MIEFPPGDPFIVTLMEALSYADLQEKKVTFQFSLNTVKFKVGEGMWSPPYHGISRKVQ